VTLTTARVPVPFQPPFLTAEQVVGGYFGTMNRDPAKGLITIGGERYVLVRAMSLSVHFFEFMKEMYPGLTEGEAIEGAGAALFDMAFSLGRSDARAFCAKLHVGDPIAKLSSGPVHFAHTGWAFVDISSESNAVPNDDYLLIYDHPQSFEADSWLARGERTTFCTCHMNAGYSSGWCSESFGLDLAAREITCRARGDEACRFVMAPRHRLEQQVAAYLARAARAA
jgi:two-component system, cell cycle sensor histidine kinase and response regulator CckA